MKFIDCTMIWAISACVVLAVGCQEDAIDKGVDEGDGVIAGQITYGGTTAITRIGFALFDRSDNPPVTPPVVSEFVPVEAVAAGIELPISYRLETLPPGTYWGMAYGDVDPSDGPFPKAIDPASEWQGPIEIASAPIALDLELADGRWNAAPPDGVPDAGVLIDAGDDAPTPQPGRAVLYGTVTYDGEAEGRLVVFGSSTPGPDYFPAFAPPIAIDAPAFPQSYEKLDLTAGRIWVFAYIDVDPEDGLTNTDVDPRSMAEVEVTLAPGTATRVDLHIDSGR